MRIWVDLTNSPHVLVLRPLIEVMRADGHEVEVTARDFAQTLELCKREVKPRPATDGLRVRRDPRELVKLLLAASES
jgi:Protein of unknown function (DUF354)